MEETSEEERKEYTLTLRALLRDYIPNQLLRDVDEEKSLGLEGLELMRFYVENSNKKLRMYGCAEDLAKNLEIYSDFPLRRKKYPVGMSLVDNSKPIPYFNTKREVLYYKQDLLFHLQHSVHKHFKHKNMPEELLKYMKCHRNLLDVCYEFVKYDKTVFDQIRVLFPFSEDLEITAEKKGNGMAKSEDPCGTKYIDHFEKLISAYPTVFHPNCETKNKKATMVVRIFEDHTSEKFIMESELFNAINFFKKPDEKLFECNDKDGYLKTIDMKEVFTATYRDQIQGIDFIRTKIRAANSKAVPIPTHSGDYCILAYEALIGILRRLIRALNIFEKVKRNTWHFVPKFVAFLGTYFPPEMEYKYFINLNLIKQLESETDKFWKQFDEKPVKSSVRDVGPNGFTAEDVKKESKHLGITDIFPEITSGLTIMFFSMLQNSETKMLTTSDMFYILERCQVKCLVDRFPSLKTFLHHQKVCQPNNCSSCSSNNDSEEKKIAKKVQMKTRNSQAVVFDVASKKVQKQTLNISVNGKEMPAVELEFVPCSVAKKPKSVPKKVGGAPKKVEQKKESEKPPKVLDKKESDACTDELTPEEKKLFDECIGKSQDHLLVLMAVLENHVTSQEIVSLVMGKLSGIMYEQYKNYHEKLDELEKENEEKLKKEKKNTIYWQNKSLEQEKLKMLETKKVKDLEKKLKDKEKENEKLKLANSKIIEKQKEEIDKLKKSQSQVLEDARKEIERLNLNAFKSSEEIQKLKSRLCEKEVVEFQMKQCNLELNETIQKMANQAETDLIRMEEEFDQKDAEILVRDRLQKSTTRQIEEQTRVNQELQETISIMSDRYEQQANLNSLMAAECENQAETIKKLLDRITSLSKPQSSEGPCPLRRQLMGLRKLKDNLEVRSPLKLAKDISQRLTTLSNRTEIQEMASHEYQQFEGKHQILLQEVIGNIQKLKASDDVLEFPPLPEYPSFSDQFVNEYWNEIEKQKASTSSESTDSGILEDSECLICFAEMKEEEQTLKCDHCRKILHLECASKWLKIHRSCPHCRREQLDPNEFPALG